MNTRQEADQYHYPRLQGPQTLKQYHSSHTLSSPSHPSSNLHTHVIPIVHALVGDGDGDLVGVVVGGDGGVGIGCVSELPNDTMK